MFESADTRALAILLYDNITGCSSADQYLVCITLKLMYSEKSLKMNTSI